MYKLIKRFLVFLIPLVSLLALRYIVDPYDDYSWQIIPPLEHNPRRDKVESYLSNGKYDYDIFVLGTSRAMRLDFGENAFNFGVFAAKTEDIYCILRFILDHCTTLPKYIVIGIDPEIFHNHSSILASLVNEPLLGKYLLLNTNGYREYTINVLQSMSDSFIHSIVAVRNYITGGSYDTFIELKPGTGSFINHYSHCRLEELSSKSILEVTGMFKNYTALDQNRITYFNKLISLCNNNDIRVLGFITPLHPQLDIALQHQESYPQRLGELFNYLDDITYDGFSYVDFSLPKLFNGDDYDFFDSRHIGDYNAELLVERLLELIEE